MAELPNTTVETPDITTVVNQQVFIEPLGGPKHPINYLDAFPETLYNKALDSNLVSFMYALLGPAGVGTLKQNYLEARLAVEANGLRTTELDALYANPFSFARLAFETYTDDTEGLLSHEQWENIQESDSSYKNRAINFLKAVRAGGTVLGLQLAAKSALNRSVEVIENYRALYDRFSDHPLELELLGITDSTEEVILLPRQERPQSSQQIVSLEGAAVAGEFKLTMPLGPGGKQGEEVQNTTTTSGLPYNVGFEELQLALESLSVIGNKNVSVTGGPFPSNPLIIGFTNELADTPLPQLLVTYNSLTNIEEKIVEVEIEVGQVGVSADGEVATIPIEDWYYAQDAINQIKPVTTILSFDKAPGLTKRTIPSASFADSEFTEVLRYVTGKRGLAWPEPNATNWIEPGIENEAPIAINGKHAHYVNFHNIASAIAYEDEALKDSEYETNDAILVNYKNEHVGLFSPEQQAQYPFLQIFNKIPSTLPKVFAAIDAASNPPEPLTTKVGPEPLVNYSYPQSLSSLTVVKGGSPLETVPFWSSNERLEGTDYLEIDLGTAQAVNYVVFETSQKNFDIGISYDLLDSAPERSFVSFSYTDTREAESELSVRYEAKNLNQWSIANLNVCSALGTMVYTRFIRLEFIRPKEESLPFAYSVDVRNLRIGRNLAP